MKQYTCWYTSVAVQYTFARAVFDAAIAAIAVATAVVAIGSATIVAAITVLLLLLLLQLLSTASVATVIVVTATDEASTHVGTLQTCYLLLQEWYLMQL